MQRFRYKLRYVSAHARLLARSLIRLYFVELRKNKEPTVIGLGLSIVWRNQLQLYK